MVSPLSVTLATSRATCSGYLWESTMTAMGPRRVLLAIGPSL